MIVKKGEMWHVWDLPNNVFVITTNATIKRNGALVMGRGIAREARDKFPGLDIAIGRAISRAGNPYGFLMSPKGKMGIFQVKDHFKAKASLELIKRSAVMLSQWAQQHPQITVNLNFPGIGWGHLKSWDVAPQIRCLPDNVHVWVKK